MHIFHPANLGLTDNSTTLKLNQINLLTTKYSTYFPGKNLYVVLSKSSLTTKLVLNILAYLTLGLIHRLKSFEDCWLLYTKGLKIAVKDPTLDHIQQPQVTNSNVSVHAGKLPINTPSPEYRTLEALKQVSTNLRILIEASVFSPDADLTPLTRSSDQVNRQAREVLLTLEHQNPDLYQAIDRLTLTHKATWPTSDLESAPNEQDTHIRIKLLTDDLIRLIQIKIGDTRTRWEG